MDWLWSVNVVLSGVSVLVALGILVFSRRNVATVSLAAFLAFKGLWFGGSFLGMGPWGWSASTWWTFVLVGMFATFGAIVCFALTYPGLALTSGRKRALGGVVLLALGGMIVVGLWPGWFIKGGGFTFELGLTGLGWGLREAGMAGGYVVAFVVLGHRWLSSPQGAYRTQVVWGLIPILFWTLHDALGWWVLPMFLGPSEGFSWWLREPWTWPGLALWLVGLGIALGLCAWALVQLVRGRAGPDERGLALLAPFLVAVSLPQVVDLHRWGEPLHVHLTLDFLIVALIAYGVLRHNVVDLDLKFKRSIKHSTVVAAFVAVFFVVSEGAKVIFAGFAGSELLGVLAAGVLVFFIAPLQRFGEAISGRVVRASDEGEYLTYRRLQIYRVALEGALKDGSIHSSEVRALESLRGELGITDEDHEQLEREVRERWQGSSWSGIP